MVKVWVEMSDRVFKIVERNAKFHGVPTGKWIAIWLKWFISYSESLEELPFEIPDESFGELDKSLAT